MSMRLCRQLHSAATLCESAARQWSGAVWHVWCSWVMTEGFV